MRGNQFNIAEQRRESGKLDTALYRINWIQWALGLGVGSAMTVAIIEAIVAGVSFSALD